MIKENKNTHSVDSFFVLCVLLIIGVMVSLVLLFSMRAYESVVASTEDNFQLRTSIMYVSNKVKSFDEEKNISVEEFNNGDALVFTQDINGQNYVTKIYKYEDNLMELFTEEGNELEPVVGTPITEISGFNIEEIDDGVLKITVTSPDGKPKSLICSIYK